MNAEPRVLREPLQWLKSRFGGRRRQEPERRTHVRQRLRFEAEIRKSNGTFPAVGVDIHEDGARVLTSESYDPGTVVFLTLKNVQLGGFAEVRHCALRGDGRFSTGLAFRGPLLPQGATWQVQRVHQTEDPWTMRDDKLPVEGKPREVA
jgi:hypothetical protein